MIGGVDRQRDDAQKGLHARMLLCLRFFFWEKLHAAA